MSKGYKEDEELLGISFHDSNLIEVDKKSNVLTLVISIDTYWYPGKPFGILKIIDPVNEESLIKAWKDEIDFGLIKYIEIRRKLIDGRTWPFLIMKLEEGKKDIHEIMCSNFWLDRVETYGEHQKMDESIPYQIDVKKFLEK